LAVLSRVYRWTIEPLVVLFYLAMILIMFAAVLCRYVLGFSLPWSEEVSLYLYIWVVFMAAAIGLEHGVHIGLDVFIDLLPKAARLLADLAGLGAQLLLYAFIFVVGMQFVKLGAFQIGTSVPVSRALVYAVIPLSGLLMVIGTIIRIVTTLKGGDRKW